MREELRRIQARIRSGELRNRVCMKATSEEKECLRALWKMARDDVGLLDGNALWQKTYARYLLEQSGFAELLREYREHGGLVP